MIEKIKDADFYDDYPDSDKSDAENHQDVTFGLKKYKTDEQNTIAYLNSRVLSLEEKNLKIES